MENAAVAHLQAADRLAVGSPLAGKAYFLSQGEPEPLWDFVNRILAVAGLPPVMTKRVPRQSPTRPGRCWKVLYRLFRLQGEPPMTRFVARQLSTAHWFDLSAAKKDIGYAPCVSTAEGLRRLGEWLKEHAATR